MSAGNFTPSKVRLKVCVCKKKCMMRSELRWDSRWDDIWDALVIWDDRVMAKVMTAMVDRHPHASITWYSEAANDSEINLLIRAKLYDFFASLSRKKKLQPVLTHNTLSPDKRRKRGKKSSLDSIHKWAAEIANSFLSLILMSLIYGLIEHRNYANVAESSQITVDMRALCGCHWKLSGVSLSAIQVCENVAALKVNFGFSLSLQMKRILPL